MTGSLRATFRALGMGALALLLSFGFAEGMLRLYVVAVDTPLTRKIATHDPLAVIRVPHGSYGYRQKPNAIQEYPNGSVATANEMGFRGPPVAWHKPAGTFRIVLLGGSATHGWGTDDADTIDAYMRARFAQKLPGVAIEVVNLALDGYDSAQVFERMRSDGVRLSPDLVIVNSGINDVRNARLAELGEPPDPRTSIWESAMQPMRREMARGGPSLWTRLKHHFYLARFPGILHDRRLRAAEVRESANDVVPNPEALHYFERSLEMTWELIAESGGALILSTPPSALSQLHAASDRERISYWINDAATTEAVRGQLASRMRSLAERLAAGGAPVRYVAHELPVESFLDDCHLNAAGNRALAERFVDDSLEFVSARIATPDP